MFTEADRQQSLKRQALAASATEGKVFDLRSGRKTMQVDSAAFHNARIQNQRVYGVDNIWAEQEFCDDMCKRHPELAVKSQSRKTTIGGAGAPNPRGRLIRGLGRSTFHARYG